jgi:hypothetical protein
LGYAFLLRPPCLPIRMRHHGLMWGNSVPFVIPGWFKLSMNSIFS